MHILFGAIFQLVRPALFRDKILLDLQYVTRCYIQGEFHNTEELSNTGYDEIGNKNEKVSHFITFVHAVWF